MFKMLVTSWYFRVVQRRGVAYFVYKIKLLASNSKRLLDARCHEVEDHRRTSRGSGGVCSPPSCGNNVIFRVNRS